MKQNDHSVSLVTGGAGFIGSHVARHLLGQGHRVIVLDDLSGGFTENIPDGAEFIQGSVTDESLVDRIFTENNIRYVFHLAAYAAEGLSHFIKKFNYTNNVLGSIHLINASIRHQIECFVFTSSIAVYGKGQLPMIESMTPAPEDPYGIAKYAIELELKSSHEMFGLNYIIFRPHNVYGPLQNIGDRYRNVVGIFMNQILQGKDLTLFGDGTQTRAFSYIDDVAPHIARSVDIPAARNEVYNIGSDVYYSLNELATLVMQSMDRQVGIRHLTARNEVAHAWSDHSKAAEAFGTDAYTSLEEGLRHTAGWVVKHGSRKSEPFKHIEITRNLPAVWLEE